MDHYQREVHYGEDLDDSVTEIDKQVLISSLFSAGQRFPLTVALRWHSSKKNKKLSLLFLEKHTKNAGSFMSVVILLSRMPCLGIVLGTVLASSTDQESRVRLVPLEHAPFSYSHHQVHICAQESAELPCLPDLGILKELNIFRNKRMSPSEKCIRNSISEGTKLG